MIEETILSNLIFKEEYSRKVIPFLKTEYFSGNHYKIVYDLIDKFINQYNALPTKSSLQVDLDSKVEGLDENTYNKSQALIESLTLDVGIDLNWLIEKTEKFCQDAAIKNGILTSIEILDSKEKTLNKGAIPKILQDALAVTFDTNIGHDFTEDWESRYDFYHNKEEKIPFDIEFFNKITNGGLSKKTLTVILAGTGVGKTRAMAHFAANNLRDGKNVLYITLEMSEQRIAERIDANLLDIAMQELPLMTMEEYKSRILRFRNKVKGKLIVKEYPTTTASATTFRNLLNELKIKKNFIPDIIYIDYINLCNSSRIKQFVNSYTLVKSIAEEIRGLAVEYNVPIVSATQTNREGYASSDVELTNTSESFGLPATVDLMFALILTEELDDLNQLMVKQLKNRYNDPSYCRRFIIGVDKPKMRLYDVDMSEQEGITDGPVMDNTNFGISDKPNFNFGDFK